ncbi:hypothetical protein [Metabacillus sp. Hm71]
MSEKKYPITFVAGNGNKLIARDDIQAAAFEKAGLKESTTKK